MSRIPSLYTTKPTLQELYEADNTLFGSMELPAGFDTSETTAFLMLKFNTLETIFKTAAEAKAGIAVWSKAHVGNWLKMWETLEAEYNPIENYSMTEEMKDDETVTEYGKTTERTDDLAHAKTGTETTAPDLTEEETPDETNTNSGSVYGFDSSDPVPSTESTDTRSGTNTRTTTGTSTLTYDTSDTNTGTQTTEDSGSDTQTRNYTLTRKGNIGVTTSQQMIESEMLLRCKWNMFEVIAASFQREICVAVW